MKFRFLTLTLFATLIFTSTGISQEAKNIATVEGITEYQLDNGLKVLLFPDQSKQTITVNITYLVGSRHEGYGETGMAHLLEHMVFKGTPDHKNIPKELSDHGAQPNGTTFYDRTNYFETFAATEENLRWALDLESDRMINSFIAKEDLESEMTVVRNEFEAGENYPQSVLWKRVTSAAYSWHNYGNTTIGARADIENVPIERLQAFYKNFYQPDNAVLLVAGKFDEEATLDLVLEYFNDVPRPERELIPTYTKEPTQDGEKYVTLERKGDVQVVSCLYKVASGLHRDDAALTVLSSILTSEPAGRVYKALVEKKLASSQSGFLMSLKEPGYMYFNVEVLKENSLENAKEALLSVFDSLVINPPGTEEVERAKAENLKNLELFMTNTEQVGLFMSEFISMGDWRMMFINRDRIEAVTVEDIERVIDTYFKSSNRTIGTFIPSEEEPDRVAIPDAPSVETLVADYKGRENMDQGEAFDPSPANIEERTSKGKFDFGGEYAFLPKETKGDIVEGIFGFRFGSADALTGMQTINALTPMVLQRGTQKKSYQEISDALDKWKTNLNVYGAAGRIFFNFKTTKDNLENVLGLIEEMVKYPSFDENEFTTVVQEQIGNVEQNRSQPQAIAFNELQRYMNDWPEDHINHVETFDEQIVSLKDVSAEDLKKFHEEFMGASNSSFVLIGEFDEETTKSKIESAYQDWSSPNEYARVEDRPFNGEPINKNIKTPDKANAMFVASMDVPISENDDDYAALQVANYLLGGGFLNSRLATRIRVQDGLSYGVGSFLNSNVQDDFTTFTSYAIYAPEVKEKLETAFFEELDKVIKDGFTQEELDAAKSGILQNNLVNRSKDQNLKGVINNNLAFDRDMLWYEKYEEQISDLTVEDINKAFVKYIDPAKLNIVKAGDFDKKVVEP